MRALFEYTRKPGIDLLVTVSAAWSTLTFTPMTNTNPCGCGIFGERSSFPSKCPIHLVTSSYIGTRSGLIPAHLDQTLSQCYDTFSNDCTYGTRVPCDPILVYPYGKTSLMSLDKHLPDSIRPSPLVRYF